MKERPILMSTENVKAILEGGKTQTRRAIKPQPIQVFFENKRYEAIWLDKEETRHFCNDLRAHCPYGQVGDVLWVKETWCAGCANEPERCACYKVLDDGRLPKFFPACRESIVKPSIFMPRWASRINLEITGIRVERVQEITQKDVVKEGFTLARCDDFIGVWDSLNPKYPWESNPWVWVISFKRLLRQ